MWLLICFCVFLISTDAAQGKRCRSTTVHKVLSTWDEANYHCQREGGLLASPIDNKILNAMKSLMKADKMYHIGIRAVHQHGTYESLEGVSIEDMTEAIDDMVEEIDPLEGECMAMDLKNIRVIPCWKRLQHFCYYKNSNHSSDGCCNNKDYKYHSSSQKCYKVGTGMSWDEAFYKCALEGGRLAVVENEHDKENVVNLMNELHHESMCIGVRDRTGNGDWERIDGSPVEDKFNVWYYGTKPWNPGGPCVAMYKSGTLIVITCNSKMAYICEKAPI